jgi:hypothetical protein
MEPIVFSQKTLPLNAQQAEIVKYEPCTNIRILASAGSGKTTTITARIAYLIQYHKVREDSIFLTTFSRNASDTMKERIDALIGSTRVYAGTFHALANQILRERDPDRLKDLYHVDELPLKFLEFLGSDKGRQWVGRLHYLIIDEFQDINEIQYDIIKRLHHPGANLTIVGDDAQNIYTWRGSCVDYILDFHRRVRNVQDFQLSINYRSTESIVAVANSIMRHIPTLPHKERMTATIEGGEKPEVRYFYRSADERNYIHNKILELKAANPHETIAILSKFNSVLYAYEETLIREGVPVTMGDRESNPLFLHEKPVTLCTLHSAKGLEWDHVFMVRLNDDVFPQKKDDESLLQERRLFYVGVTRARKTLTLSYSKGEHNLSRFVREIHRPLLTWFSATQYRLSSNEFEGKSRSLRSAIESLQGEDFRFLKEHPVALPAWLKTKSYDEILKPRSLFPIGETWRLPAWVSQKDLQNEWGQFLKAYILRVIGTYRAESGGKTDAIASDVVWTIKIAAEDAIFFDENQSIIERIVRFLFPLAGDPLHTPPQITYHDILEALAKLYPSKTWDHPSVIHIVQIIHKIRTTLYNLRYVEYRMDLLRFASISYSPPQEYRCDLIRAWFKTTQSATPSINLLPELYLMGGTHIVKQGRNLLFYRQPKPAEWASVRDYLCRLENDILQNWVINAETILARVQYEDEELTASADLIMDKALVQIQHGSTLQEMKRLELLVELFAQAHLVRTLGYEINTVVLFQPLSGLWLEMDITDWDGETLDAYLRSKLAVR